MLSKLFHPARHLNHADPDKRRRALDRLDAETAQDCQEELAQFVQAESERTQRAKALAFIGDKTTLTALLKGNAQIVEETAMRVADLCHLGTLDANDTLANHPRVVSARLAQCETDEARSLLAKQLPDATLAELVAHAKPPMLDKLLAIPELKGEGLLVLLEKHSRNNKVVNRFAREHLTRYREALAAHSQQKQKLEHLTLTVTKVAAETPDDATSKELRRSHLLALQQQHGQMREELLRINAILAEYQSMPEVAETDPFAQLDLSPPEASPYHGLLEQLEQLEQLSTHDPSKLQQQLDEVDNQWQQLKRVRSPSTDEQRIYTTASARWGEQLAATNRLQTAAWPVFDDLPGGLPKPDEAHLFWEHLKSVQNKVRAHAKLEKQINWPSNAPLPPTIQQQREARATAQSSLDQIDAQLAEHIQTLEDELQRAHAAIEEGQSKNAAQLLAQARASVDLLPPSMAGKSHQGRLAQLSKRLQEMREWQQFATSPKRESLIQSMQHLVEASLEPDARANRVKALRQEWNALGRATNRNDHELQRQFDEAAEQAFEPCRQFFDAQAQERENNLTTRNTLVTNLQRYLAATDWDNADFKAAETILRTAREEWRNASPVPRNSRSNKLTKQFETLQTDLHNRIGQYLDQNLQAKQAILNAAEALASLELGERITGIKDLQAQWKTIGPAPRKAEQKLWQTFRAIADEIFDQRAAESSARDAEFQARVEAAKTLQSGLKDTLTAPERRLLNEYLDAYSALGNLGRTGKSAQSEHKTLVTEYESALHAKSKQQQISQLTDLEAEDRRLAEADAEGIVTDSEYKPFQQRTTGDIATLQRLTLLAEIAAELGSPQEDQEARLALQVELMNQRLKAPSDRALLKEWCAVADKGTTEAVCALRARFFAALRSLQAA